jgi:hypothetical protein
MSAEAVIDGGCPICGHIPEVADGRIPPCVDWQRVGAAAAVQEEEQNGAA